MHHSKIFKAGLTDMNDFQTKVDLLWFEIHNWNCVIAIILSVSHISE